MQEGDVGEGEERIEAWLGFTLDHKGGWALIQGERYAKVWTRFGPMCEDRVKGVVACGIFWIIWDLI
jgi:hypothetical protein